MNPSHRGALVLAPALVFSLVAACTSPDMSSIDPAGAEDETPVCGNAVSTDAVALTLGLVEEAQVVSETDEVRDLGEGTTVPFRCQVGTDNTSLVQFSFFSGNGDIARDYLSSDIDEGDRVETFAGIGVVVGRVNDDGDCLGATITHPSLLLIVGYGAAQVPDGRDACQDAMALALQTFNNLDLPQYDSAPIPNPRQFQWDGVIPLEAEDLVDGPFVIEPSTDG